MNFSLDTFVLRSRRIITPNGVRDGGIVIEGETIRGIVPMSEVPHGTRVEDAGTLAVLPGLVDAHVHINEPGRAEWEGFATATRAAAAGGITTLVDMPLNSSPVTTTLDAFRQKLDAAAGKLSVDCGFYGGVIPGNAGDIPSLIEAGVLGMKAFLVHSGIDDFPNASEADLRAAMPVMARYGIPLLVHCELDQSPAPVPAGDGRSYGAYLASRPRRWEHDAIALVIRLAKEYRCRVHIVHLSSADAVPALREARRTLPGITVETCPHYLYFTSEGIPDGDTRFKCAPPIRERENCRQLWTALRDGDIDFIASDHSPSPPELKCLETGDFRKAWGGIASLQFGLPVLWTEARKRGLTLSHIAEWMSRRPAQFIGMDRRKGTIAEGFDADLVVWDPDEGFTVERSSILHRHTLTPYDGERLFGVVKKTFLRGRMIFDAGTFTAEPSGRVLLRKTS